VPRQKIIAGLPNFPSSYRKPQHPRLRASNQTAKPGDLRQLLSGIDVFINFNEQSK